MRRNRLLLAFAAVALVALPVGASIKAMNLEETLELHTDVVQGTIVSKDTVVLDHPWEGSVYTRLTIEGTSLLTGETGTTEALFMGSHDPKDRFFHSEMPELKDVRLGNEVLVMIGRHADVESVKHLNILFNLGSVYRIERGFGEPVVIGKGEGFAFSGNVRLTQARTAIEETHQAILAKRAMQAAPAGK